MVSAFVHGSSGPGSSPGRDTVLCSWARHLTLTVPLSTQEYKWVLVICWGNLANCWGGTCDGLASHPGGVEILLAASCYGNRINLRPDEPVGSMRLHFTSLSCRNEEGTRCSFTGELLECFNSNAFLPRMASLSSANLSFFYLGGGEKPVSQSRKYNTGST